MPRRPRRPAYAAGHFYHICNRGAHRQSIFRTEDDYFFVLRKLGKYLAELQLSLIAYCLLPNHYHLLVRQDSEMAAGLLPQRVFNAYSKSYNPRYDHSGTLFEAPYEAVLVDSENYLLHLCRYIHANPVKHELVTGLEDWPYSNYPEWIGVRDGELFDRDFVASYFPKPKEYRAFISDYLETRHIPEEIRYVEAWELE